MVPSVSNLEGIRNWNRNLDGVGARRMTQDASETEPLVDGDPNLAQQVSPILSAAIDAITTLVDNRNRLAACKLAGVEPPCPCVQAGPRSPDRLQWRS